MIARLLAFARRRRWFVLAVTAGVAIVSAVLAARISFGTDVLSLLPQDDPSLRGLRRYLERFETANQLYIVFTAPAGRQIEDSREIIDAYLTRLRTLPEIAKVDAGLFDPGKDWAYLRERTFMLIGPDATRDALGLLDEAGMRQALLRSRDLLSAPGPGVRSLVQSDPLGLFQLIRTHFAADRALAKLGVSQRGYYSSDGGSQLVIATPAGLPFDNAFCRQLFERLDTIEQESRSQSGGELGFATALSIRYAGGHRIAFETEAIMKREAALNSLTSVSAILLLLLLVFRSAWLFFVGAVPMAVAALSAIAINSLIHGQLSAAATGTSALLFGLGIDGLVLMYARYLEEVESGVPPDVAIGRLAGAGTSMLLGCFTTAATFFSLTWIDVPGLQEFGRLVGLGMLLGGPLTLLLVAALLPRRVTRPRALSLRWLAGFVRRRRWAILAGASLVTLAAVPQMRDLDLDLRFQRLQPDIPSVRLQRDLEERFGVDRDVALALADGPSLDAVLTIDRRFETALRASAPALYAVGPSRLLPPSDEQAETGRVLTSAAEEITAIQARLRRVASEVGFRAGAIDEFIAQLPRLLDPAQRLTYDGYIEHGLGDLISRHVVRGPDGFTTASYVEVADADNLARAAAAAASVGPEVTLTGVPAVNATLAGRFRSQFVRAMAAGSAVVFLFMLITFRKFHLTLLAFAPTVLGLIWAAALLAWMDVRLDLFSIFAMLTLIGIGVDYGIHLVHRAAGEPGDLDVALARVAPANIVAAGIALLGCGSLAASTYPPLRSLGLATVVGLCTCLVTSVLVLPAALMVLTRKR